MKASSETFKRITSLARERRERASGGLGPERKARRNRGNPLPDPGIPALSVTKGNFPKKKLAGPGGSARMG